VVSRLPRSRRDDIDRGGRASFTVLAAFLRGTSIVATFDAIVVGLGLWLIGVPLILPLAVLTFILAFIPVVGAIVACSVAALVALATNGVSDALLVVLLSLIVNQLEGVLVSPFAIGRAVSLHPAAVLLSVTAGASIVGIAGAFLAVPLLAVTLTFVRVLFPWQPDVDGDSGLVAPMTP
jgi:predicted PurR-regulated permease PerM